jgi:hypothetical protein
VLQVKVDPKKLNGFIDETHPGGHHHDRSAPQEKSAPLSDTRVELAGATSQNWDGVCLYLREEPQTEVQP